MKSGKSFEAGLREPWSIWISSCQVNAMGEVCYLIGRVLYNGPGGKSRMSFLPLEFAIGFVEDVPNSD